VRSGPARHVRDLEWLRDRADVDPVTGCWVWNRGVNHKGYGRYHFTDDHGAVRHGSAHRLALELALGRPIRVGLNALHRCDNPPCCNGAHLFEGTQADNLRDCREKGRARTPVGEANGLAKLTASDVHEIRAALARGATQTSLAGRFGIAQSQISRINTGKMWRSV